MTSRYSPVPGKKAKNLASDKWRSSLNISGRNPAYPNFNAQKI